jgi:UDP-N-acetylglucosamine 2-epimerase (non-hydrolysing)
VNKPVVITVFGTRPEAIKSAPVVQLLNADPDITHHLVVTAQHRELLDDVLELFNITAKRDLDLMVECQSLEYIAAQALTGLGSAFDELKPSFTLVHGDTTTTAMAALASFYRHIPVGHIEAGLRTSSVTEPFPEELNRRITDQIAVHYYCPTNGAAVNLGHCPEYNGRTFITGNTALDAVRLVHDPSFVFNDPALSSFIEHAGPKLLVTAHRRENWGAPLAEICHGLKLALADHQQARACFCWHPNPIVRDVIEPILGSMPQVLLVDPPRFDVFANLMSHCDLLLTDSGGIQEEVSLLKRFALVLRTETERPEAVSAGFAQLAVPEREHLRRTIADVLPRCIAGELPADKPSPFGDGYAAERIHAAVRYGLGLNNDPPIDWRP